MKYLEFFFKNVKNTTIYKLIILGIVLFSLHIEVLKLKIKKKKKMNNHNENFHKFNFFVF